MIEDIYEELIFSKNNPHSLVDRLYLLLKKRDEVKDKKGFYNRLNNEIDIIRYDLKLYADALKQRKKIHELISRIHEKMIDNPNMEVIRGVTTKEDAKPFIEQFNQIKNDRIKSAKAVEELEQKLFFVNQKTSGENYSIVHDDNRDWLEKHFKLIKEGNFDFDSIGDEIIKEEILNIRGRVQNRICSDNLTAKRLAVLYYFNFGIEISPDQIKGMVVYKNR